MSGEKRLVVDRASGVVSSRHPFPDGSNCDIPIAMFVKGDVAADYAALMNRMNDAERMHQDFCRPRRV